MKEEFLVDIINGINDTFVREAEAAAPARRSRGRIMLLAAVLAAAICIVGFTVASRYYFAPGVGIVTDESTDAPQVWACNEPITLGDKVFESIVLSQTDGTGTLSVWYWDDTLRDSGPLTEEKKTFAGQSSMFNEMKNRLRAMVVLTGVQFKPTSWSGGNTELQCYTFQKFPFSETIYLRDAEGNTATVQLTPINESQYAHIDGTIHLSDEVSLSIVPISGSSTLFAAQLTDPLTAAMTKDFTRMHAQVFFNTRYTNGETGKASGAAIVTDSKNTSSGGSAVSLSRGDAGNTVRDMSLRSVKIQFSSIAENTNQPRFPITVPAKGEGYDCDIVLYDGNGITCRLTRVEYNDNGLVLTSEVDNNTNSPLIKELACDVIYIYSIGDYESYFANKPDRSHTYIDHPRRISYDAETGELYCLTANDEARAERVIITPGDEIIITAGRISCTYLPEGGENATFGTINLE